MNKFLKYLYLTILLLGYDVAMSQDAERKSINTLLIESQEGVRLYLNSVLIKNGSMEFEMYFFNPQSKKYVLSVGSIFNDSAIETTIRGINLSTNFNLQEEEKRDFTVTVESPCISMLCISDLIINSRTSETDNALIKLSKAKAIQPCFGYTRKKEKESQIPYNLIDLTKIFSKSKIIKNNCTRGLNIKNLNIKILNKS